MGHSRECVEGKCVHRCVCAQKKANDPSRFNNRGGNLLKEEKQRSELQKSLPKVSTGLKSTAAFGAVVFLDSYKILISFFDKTTKDN